MNPITATVTRDDDRSPDATLAELYADQQFFSNNPQRRYRLRRGWVIRRCRRGVFLRARLADGRDWPDDERLAEKMWWQTTWPTLPPDMRTELMKAARRRKSWPATIVERRGGA